MKGFLLFNMPAIRQRLDDKLFVGLDHKKAKHRGVTRPLYGGEAKEKEFWKTEDCFEKMGVAELYRAACTPFQKRAT